VESYGYRPKYACKGCVAKNIVGAISSGTVHGRNATSGVVGKFLQYYPDEGNWLLLKAARATILRGVVEIWREKSKYLCE
jgi:hypothetical protein